MVYLRDLRVRRRFCVGFGSLKGCGGPIAKADREGELDSSFVAGKVQSPHSLERSHGHVPSVNSPPRLLGGFLGGIQTGRTFFSLGDFLDECNEEGSQGVIWGVSSYSTAEHITGCRVVAVKFAMVAPFSRINPVIRCQLSSGDRGECLAHSTKVQFHGYCQTCSRLPFCPQWCFVLP